MKTLPKKRKRRASRTAKAVGSGAMVRAFWTRANPPKVGDWFILKSSYCGKDNPKCTEATPCPECLSMCNRFVIAAEHYGKDFFFGGGWCNRDGGHLLNETYSAVLTFDEDKADGVRCIHHVSEALPISRP